MGTKKESPPGGGGSSGSSHSSSTTTPKKLGGGSDGNPCRMRTFEEITADEKKNRNILIVKLTKIETTVKGEEVKECEDVGGLLFDVVQLKVEDCAGISLSTNRYDTKEINLKPSVDPTPYLTTTPITFKGHQVMITKERIDTTKVTFKNVP